MTDFRFKCKGCGKMAELYLSPENQKRRKFCSRACFQANGHKVSLCLEGNHNAPRVTPFVQCETCSHLVCFGKIPGNFDKMERFCSLKCMGLGKRGEAHHNWKPGSTIRKITEAYKEWRKDVLKRDDYSCTFCGKRGGRLESDHILPWAIYDTFRLEVGNGRTVCPPCHRKHGSRPQRKAGVVHWL